MSFVYYTVAVFPFIHLAVDMSHCESCLESERNIFLKDFVSGSDRSPTAILSQKIRDIVGDVNR